MAATFTFTEKPDGSYYTLAEINAVFTAIKAVVDAKLDVRGDTLGATIIGDSITILNVPEPEDVGDLLRN